MGTPFGDSVLGGNDELVRNAIRSANYGVDADGVITGWSINRDGSAEFHDVTIGNDLYSIDEMGQASVAELSVLGSDITIGGRRLLGDELADRSKGIIAVGHITANTSAVSAETGFLELSADLEDGRIYRLRTSSIIIQGNTAGDDFRLGIRTAYAPITIANSQHIVLGVVDIFTQNSDRPNVDLELIFRCDLGESVNRNPDFDTNVDGAALYNATVERSTEAVYPGGVASMKINPAGASPFDAGAGSELTDVGSITAGQSYVLHSLVFSPTGGDRFQCLIHWYDAAGTFLSQSVSPQTVVPANEWTVVQGTVTAPANASRGIIWSYQGFGGTPSQVLADNYWYVYHLKIGSVPDDLINFLPGQNNYLLTLTRLTGTGTAFLSTGTGNYNPISMYVEDLGTLVPDTGKLAGGGAGGGGTPTQTYTKTYYATWGCSYRGAGATCGSDGSRFNQNGSLYQGRYSSCNADTRSWIGFDYSQIQADLAGATVKKFEVYLYFNHWYYNSGGTAVIGTHNSSFVGSGDTGPSFSEALDDTDRKRVSNWPKPGGKWVDLGTAIGNQFKAGTMKGIVLGTAPDAGNLIYYGHANDANSSNQPALRITYTK